MAIKKFSAYIEEAIAQDYVAPKDSDKEATGYQPRAKGEQDFANLHKVEKRDYAIPGQDHVFNGTIVKEEVELDEEVSPEVMKMVMRFGKDDEKARFRRYAADKGGLRPDEKRDRDKIVAVSRGRARAAGALKEDIDEAVDLTEGKVMDGLKQIVDKKSAGTVKFANGKSLKVDMTTANAMLNLYKKINDKNKGKMEDQIEKSPEVFMKLMDLAFGGK